MKIKPIKKKLRLYGFNNLTKSLSFNLYDVCYATNEEQRKEYLEYVDEEYNAERLAGILTDVSNIIGACVLNIARQDYEPQGASVTMLIAEEELHKQPEHIADESPGPESIVGHLDTSHITVHTYPESHPSQGVITFRADIDVSTCGRISPLKALNYLMNTFKPDIAIMDYRVRGFTRDVNGRKFFLDHKIDSIQNYIPTSIKDLYQMIDVNVYQENIFHTKMFLKEFNLDNYLFGTSYDKLPDAELEKIKQQLKKEMLEIYYGRNFS
ncbi:s-adenosylmethionine decarboxylase proenzyme, prokaryotic class 1a [hydrocarbon metagenome]|uniref:S-adenosylmethionine decarboxylase proenzyme, prokaryotic class 1a n=1 Tax=hydrocarbon metagenome TaxID=938273 RepID=A0A0W8E9M7_9ZZZZ